MTTKNIFKLFFVIALLLSEITVLAQQYNFRQYSIEDGLPQSQVNSIYQDNHGYLWIGTTGGVCKFDGADYEVFDTDDGLSSNEIKSFYQYQGDIYLGTAKGLTCVKEDSLYAINNIEFIVNDILSWNNKLVLATDKGLYYLSTDTIIKFSTASKLDDLSTTCLLEDKNGNLWVGTSENSIFKLNRNESGLQIEHIISEDKVDLKVRDIVESKDGSIWIGTSGNGIYLYNGDAIHKVILPDYIGGNYISSISIDKQHNLWFGTWGNGVIKYDGNVFSNYNKANGLVDNVVLNVYSDFEGNVWFGTLTKGAAMFTGEMFYSLTIKDGLKDNNIRGLVKTNDGDILISTLDGIGVFDGLDIDVINEKEGLSYNRVGPLVLGNDDEVIAGTFSGDLNTISSNKVVDVSRVHKDELFEIISLYKLDKNKYLVGVYKKGLYLYDSGIAKKVLTDEHELPSSYSVWSICKDGNSVLIGTDFGVWEYNNEKLDRFVSFEGLPNNISVNDIKSSNELLCVSTKSSGLYVFKRDVVKWFHFEKKNNLPLNNVLSVAIVNENSVVATTVMGISQFEFQEDTFRNRFFGKEQGVSNTEFTSGVSIVVDDEVWFGTGKGVLVFNVNKEDGDDVLPKVNINDVALFYGKENIEQYKEDTGDLAMVLPYDKNHVTFSYDAIHFKAIKHIKFQYQLVGNDLDWSPLTKDRHITFTNLGSGDFSFKLRATTNNGRTFSNPAMYQFSIETPFWRQIWFYGLVLLGFLLIGVSYVYYSRKQKIRLERLIDAKTKELKSSEEKYKYIIESASDTIYQTNLKGDFIYANEMSYKLTGYSKEDLLGLNYVDLVLNSYENKVVEFYENQIKNKSEETYLEFPISTKTNQIKWVAQTVKPLIGDDNLFVGFQAIIRDITDKKESQDKLQLFANRLEIVNSIDKAVLQAQSLKEVIHNTLGKLFEILKVERISITLFDYKQQNFLSYSISNFKDSKLSDGKVFPLSHFGGLSNIESGNYYLIDQLSNISSPSDSDLQLMQEGIESYLLYPLNAYGELFGSLNVSSKEKDVFNSDIIKTIEEVSNAVAVAIYQNKLLDKLKESEERFRELFEGTIDLIVTVNDEGEILFANRAFTDAINSNKGDIVFAKIKDDNKEQAFADFTKIKNAVGISMPLETVFVTDLGQDVIISGNAMAKIQEGGEVVVTCIMHDITEQKQNEEIIRQKNEDILDSIVYAQRIQKAILPTDNQLALRLPNSFVIYEPKEIVSGDFYFTESVTDGDKQLSVIGVGDCTGHGVPGAFMSLFAHNFLKQSIKEGSVTSPAEALNFVRSNLLKSFREGNLDDIIYDGMDIALLTVDYENMMLGFSGAYRPVYIIRGKNIIEIKGDRQPIGFFENMKPFTNHEFKLNKGDSVYIFTDGITDQFGGENKKKYSSARFKKLLTEISEKDINQQSEIVQDSWFEWMGEVEQTDDVCLVGFKV